ncbi:MAG: hypothetical protein ACP5TZ_04650 [Nitrososphaeria archaeon]
MRVNLLEARYEVDAQGIFSEFFLVEQSLGENDITGTKRLKMRQPQY